jgi:ABC-type multidrug transport system permease subunit
LIWFGLVCLFVCACVCLCEVIYIFDRAVCTLLS